MVGRYRNKMPPFTPDPEHWTRKSRKAPDNHYAEPVLTFSIPFEVDPEMFHYVKSVKRTDFYQFLLIKERDIIDIIINKDYD